MPLPSTAPPCVSSRAPHFTPQSPWGEPRPGRTPSPPQCSAGALGFPSTPEPPHPWGWETGPECLARWWAGGLGGCRARRRKWVDEQPWSQVPPHALGLSRCLSTLTGPQIGVPMSPRDQHGAPSSFPSSLPAHVPGLEFGFPGKYILKPWGPGPSSDVHMGKLRCGTGRGSAVPAPPNPRLHGARPSRIWSTPGRAESVWDDDP